MLLCAGAFNSPQILKLSGIGPAMKLRQHGIDVHADLPGVGENLQDHLDLLVQYRCKQPVSLYPATRPLGRLLVGLRWLLFSRNRRLQYLGGGQFLPKQSRCALSQSPASLRAGRHQL